MKKTLLASALVLAFSASANAAVYDKPAFDALGGSIDVTDDIKVEGALLSDVVSLKTTGTFDWFGQVNDTATMTTDVTAEHFVYRGHVGNQKARGVSGKLVADTLSIIAEKDSTGATQKGLMVLNDQVLAGVGAIRIEAKNGGLANLSIASGVDVAYDGNVMLVNDGGNNARIEVEDQASVAFAKLIAEKGSSKIQVNHSADVKVGTVEVGDGAYFALDVWTNQDDQTARFALSEINVGENGEFRAAIYNDKKPSVQIDGDLTINLGKNGIVDFGAQRNADWDSDKITINSDAIQINVEDLSGDNHVYLSKEGTDLEKTKVTVTVKGEGVSEDVNADLAKLAEIVELTSNTDELDDAGKPVAAEKTSAKGVQLTVGEGMYAGEGSATVGEGGKLDQVIVKVNSLMSNVLDMASAQSLSMNRILMNDVRKRLGNIRSAEGTHGVWARYDGGRLSGTNAYENDFHTLQFGIDTVPVADAPRFGVAFSYTKSDADLKRGGAEMDAFGLAAYATKMYDNGAFVDVIGRLSKADTDVVVDGDKKGAMDNLVVSLSAEAGWRFNMTERHYVEPQVEVTYTRVNNSDLTLNNGSSYAFDSVDSVIGRAGFAAGFTCPNNMGDVYVRASVVREFMGDAAVRGGREVLQLDGADTWYEYGIGANFNLNKNTYVYADVERTGGAALDEDWRANVGVRYSF